MEKNTKEVNNEPENIQNKSLKVDYVKYEDLTAYDEKTNFVELFRKVSTDMLETPEVNWEIHFNTINELRRLQKHASELFYAIVKDCKLCKEIFPKYINSIRSNLSKITLMLISELFSLYRTEYLNKWVRILIPEILNKSSDSKIFIREEALKCLQNLSENMFYVESIICLLIGVKSSNAKNSQNAQDALIKLIENFDKIALENIEEWREIFKLICDIFLMKDDRHVKKSEMIVTCIKDQLGKEIFDKVLKAATKNCGIVIYKIMNLKQTKSNKAKESLKDFKNRMLNEPVNKENKTMKNLPSSDN